MSRNTLIFTGVQVQKAKAQLLTKDLIDTISKKVCDKVESDAKKWGWPVSLNPESPLNNITQILKTYCCLDNEVHMGRVLVDRAQILYNEAMADKADAENRLLRGAKVDDIVTRIKSATKALDSLKRAMEIDPDKPILYKEVASVLKKIGDLKSYHSFRQNPSDKIDDYSYAEQAALKAIKLYQELLPRYSRAPIDGWEPARQAYEIAVRSTLSSDERFVDDFAGSITGEGILPSPENLTYLSEAQSFFYDFTDTCSQLVDIYEKLERAHPGHYALYADLYKYNAVELAKGSESQDGEFYAKKAALESRLERFDDAADSFEKARSSGYQLTKEDAVCNAEVLNKLGRAGSASMCLNEVASNDMEPMPFYTTNHKTHSVKNPQKNSSASSFSLLPPEEFGSSEDLKCKSSSSKVASSYAIDILGSRSEDQGNAVYKIAVQDGRASYYCCHSTPDSYSSDSSADNLSSLGIRVSYYGVLECRDSREDALASLGEPQKGWNEIGENAV